jgi:DUF438 domain-containing protein
MTRQEWVEVRKEFDAIGYCCFTPPELVLAPKERIEEAQVPTEVLPRTNKRRDMEQRTTAAAATKA